MRPRQGANESSPHENYDQALSMTAEEDKHSENQEDRPSHGDLSSPIDGVDPGSGPVAEPPAPHQRPGHDHRHRRLPERTTWILLLLLAVGMAVRAAMVIPRGLGNLQDLNYYTVWTRALADHGLHGFYNAIAFCDYPPLYVLAMWAIGQVTRIAGVIGDDHALHMSFKAVSCLADLVIAIVLFLEARKLLGPRIGLGAAALYLLNPVAIYNSAYWGQVDAIHTLFLLLGVVFVRRGRWGAAGGAAALALLQKFQSIAVIPIIIFETYRLRGWRGVGYLAVGAIVVAACVCLPFGLTGTLDDVLGRGYVGVVGQYHALTPSAFNLWQLTGAPESTDTAVPYLVALAASDGQAGIPDTASPLLWLTWRHISLVLYSLVVAGVLSIYSSRPNAVRLHLASGLLALAFFLFPTEMHERYAHPALGLLAVWAVTSAWRERAYWLVTALLVLNLTVILPVGNIAPQIGGIMVLLFFVLLVGMGIGRFAPATEAKAVERVAVSPEDREAVLFRPALPAPRTPRLIVAFRYVTLIGWIAGLALAGIILYMGLQNRERLDRKDVVWLSELTPQAVRQGWGELRLDRSVSGGTLRLGQVTHLRGLGTHAPSHVTYRIPDGVTTFRAQVGVDGTKLQKGSVIASVELDGKQVFETDVLRGGRAPAEVDVSLAGARFITLRTHPTRDGQADDHVDWGSARFERTPSQPTAN